jgi:hypothetical protein
VAASQFSASSCSAGAGTHVPDRYAAREALAHVPAQIAGAIGGAMPADAMFGRQVVTWSTGGLVFGGGRQPNN